MFEQLILPKLKEQKLNLFVKNKFVPLGRNTSFYHHLEEYDKKKYIFSIYNEQFGLLSLISCHSSGKSVLMKRIACYWRLIWPQRPGIIFDMQGVDWRTIKYPGREGFLFFQNGEYYWGFGSDLINLTPLYLAHHLPPNSPLHNDKLYGISWREINDEEWDYLLNDATEGTTWVYKFKFHISKHKNRIVSFKHFIEESEKA